MNLQGERGWIKGLYRKIRSTSLPEGQGVLITCIIGCRQTAQSSEIKTQSRESQAADQSTVPTRGTGVQMAAKTDPHPWFSADTHTRAIVVSYKFSISKN